MSGLCDPDMLDRPRRRDEWSIFHSWLEWTFQVGLGPEDVCGAETAGQLNDLIARELEFAHETDDDSARRSLSATAVERLTKGVQDLFGVPSGRVVPGSEMDHIVPVHGRRGAWGHLAEAMDLRLPDLELAPHIARRRNLLAMGALLALILSLGLLVAGTVVDAFNRPSGLRDALADMVLKGMVLTIGLFGASLLGRPGRIPPSCRTVGETALTLIRMNPVRLGLGRLSRDEIWQVLRRALADRFEVPLDELTRDFEIADRVDPSQSSTGAV